MNSLTRCKPLLGTYVEITLGADLDDDVLIDLSITAFAEVERIHQLMSFHEPGSELSTINRHAAQTTCKLSADMQAVLTLAMQLSEASGGVFDLTVASQLVANGTLPDHGVPWSDSASWQNIQLQDDELHFTQPLLIDLGGIAKGYAVDRVFALLGDKAEVMVNAGGDLRMNQWQGRQIAIRHPVAPQLIELPMANSSLATSAGYFLERDAVIVSSKNTLSAPKNCSFSVFASSCMLADGLTKIVSLNQAAGGLIRSLGAETLSIDECGTVNWL